MRKFSLILTLSLLCMGIHAQYRAFDKTSFMPKAAYKTDINTFGLGADFRFMVADNIRAAADVTYYIPKDKTSGLDLGVNFQYLTTMIPDEFICYPMIGCVVSNNHTGEKWITSKTKIPSSSSTEVGFSVGVGGEFNIGTFNQKNYLSLELKYIFAKNSFAVASIGYGFRF